VLLEPRLDLRETFDEIEVVGSPSGCLRIVPAVEPVATAQAVTVNVIPAAVHAEPGLRTMLDVPVGARRRGSGPDGTRSRRLGEAVAAGTPAEEERR
jgi:hypothetical protein